MITDVEAAAELDGGETLANSATDTDTAADVDTESISVGGVGDTETGTEVEAESAVGVGLPTDTDTGSADDEGTVLTADSIAASATVSIAGETSMVMVRGDRHDVLVANPADSMGRATTFNVGDVLRFSAKPSFRSSDASAFVVSSVTVGSTTTSATLPILPSDWTIDHLNRDTRCVWDVQLAVGGDATLIHTIARGQIIIEADVTRTAP
jgi:hypothetical protein